MIISRSGERRKKATPSTITRIARQPRSSPMTSSSRVTSNMRLGRRAIQVQIVGDEVLGNFQERDKRTSPRNRPSKEGNRCMSCGMCFECNNCVIYCPQDAVHRVKKVRAVASAAMSIPITANASAVTSAWMSAPAATSRWGSGSNQHHAPSTARIHCRRRPYCRSDRVAVCPARSPAMAADAGSKASRVFIPPAPQKGKGDKCVADTDFMRRNHMTMLNHQRDDTVHDGIRTKQFSLEGMHRLSRGARARCTAGLHSKDPKHFCRTCHDYAAVKVDCFECHASRPEAEKAAAPASRTTCTDNALASYLKERRQ